MLHLVVLKINMGFSKLQILRSDLCINNPIEIIKNYVWVLVDQQEHQFYVDTRCNLEDLLRVMDDKDGERESGKSIMSTQLNDEDESFTIKN